MCVCFVYVMMSHKFFWEGVGQDTDGEGEKKG